jgi:hypothetical protein
VEENSPEALRISLRRTPLELSIMSIAVDPVAYNRALISNPLSSKAPLNWEDNPDTLLIISPLYPVKELPPPLVKGTKPDGLSQP